MKKKHKIFFSSRIQLSLTQHRGWLSAVCLLFVVFLSACQTNSPTVKSQNPPPPSAQITPNQAIEDGEVPVQKTEQEIAQARNAQYLYKTGIDLIDAGEHERGIETLQKAAELNSHSAHFALARMYWREEISPETEGLGSQNLMLFHLRLAADGGHPKAQTMLALLYQEGKNLPQDIPQAITYYEAAAKGGVQQAQYNLGLLYNDKNAPYYAPDRAATLWKQASAQGDIRAKARLGWLLFHGEGIQQNIPAAVDLWQQANREGNAIASWGLGYFMSLENLNSSPDYQVAAFYLNRALKAGVIEAAFPLAELYRQGKGVKASDARARELYRLSLEDAERPAAAYWVGIFALEGRGGAQNPRLGEVYLQKAYKAHYQPALLPLLEWKLSRGERPQSLLRDYLHHAKEQGSDALQPVLALLERYNIKPDELDLPADTAEKVYEEVASGGDLAMQKELARLAAEQGDKAKQQRWLERASASGDTDSHLALADLLANDDPERVLSLEKTLASANHPLGLYRLGKRYAEGNGVPKDIVKSFALLERAAAAGNSDAAFLAAQILQHDDKAGQYKQTLRRLYQQSSDSGKAEATLALAMLDTDPQKRSELFLLASQQGSAEGALGYAEQHYNDPNFTWQDLEGLYSRAANANFPLARLRIALHRLFTADKKHSAESLTLVRQMSKEADQPIRLEALRYLARLYMYGDSDMGIKPDRRAALNALDDIDDIQPGTTGLERAELARQSNNLQAAIKFWRSDGTAWSIYNIAQNTSETAKRSVLLRQATQGGVAQAYQQILPALPDDEKQALLAQLQLKRQQHIEQGQSWAIIDALIDAQQGLSGMPNAEQATKLTQLALRQGIPEAYQKAGEYLFKKNPRDSQTLHLLLRASALGQNRAKITLGRLLEHRAPQQARALWKEIADTGDTLGKLYFAWALERGIGGMEKPEQAFKIYQKLYDTGHEQAGFNIANMYLSGRGTQQNLAKGLEIYQQAAERGNARAWLQLGIIFADRRFEKIYNPTKASGFLLLAAHSGYNESWLLLGKMYDIDGTLPEDLKLAYEYYGKAAFLNVPDAQYRLGLGYLHGYGKLPKEYLTAYAWLEIAAKNGDIAASFVRDSILVDFKKGDKERVKEIQSRLENQIQQN